MKKSYLLVGLLCLSLACQKKDEVADLERPTAELKSMDEKVDISQNNAQLAYEVLFKDDKDLASYKIDIHDNFDGHGHGRVENTFSPFSFDKIYNIGGKEFLAKEKIAVPNLSATGNYHIEIKFFDRLGNEGEFIIADFEIVHPQRQPRVLITQPDFASEVHAEKGRDFRVIAKISDPDDLLDKVQVQLIQEDESHSKGRIEGGEPIFDRDFKDINARELDINLTIPIPANTPSGHYALIFKCKDKSGNHKTHESEIHIH